MGKVKNYDIKSYESVIEALIEIMAPYKCPSFNQKQSVCYTQEAYEQVATFLCLNEIQHTFIVNPVVAERGARVVTVRWEHNNKEDSLIWWEMVSSNKFYMVCFEENWGDEMDVYGFALFTDEEMAEWTNALAHLKEVMANGGCFEYFFGTNESNCYSNFGEFMDCFSTKTVTSKEFRTIYKIFGSQTYYGNFPHIEDINYYIKVMEGNNGDDSV